MALTLTSPAFADGERIPARYTCDGENDSPPLRWSGAPENTDGYVLVLHDPDAPGGDFTHWIVFDIPKGVDEFPDGASPIQTAQEGTNSSGNVGYTGPCPPPGDGPHRYVFEVFALDIYHTGLGERATREELEGRMRGHVLARAQLTGIYERSS